MRKLPLLLALLLLGSLGTAASASASSLPTIEPGPLLTFEDEEGEAEETEDEEAEDAAEEAQIERELCEEDPDFCEEEESERNQGKGSKNGGECLLKKASATVSANPGKRRLQLTVAYKALKPATVNVEASFRGAKGGLSLGNSHTRLRRSGVYRDTFQLTEKKMEKALAARDFQVELQVINTPPSCRVEVTAQRDGAKKLLWS